MYLDDAVNSAKLTSEDNRSLKIDYFITSGTCLTDGAEQVPTFGIMAKLSIDGKYTESSKIDDVSPSEETVKELVDLLAKNGVTPIALSSVVEDYVTMQL
jgi:orotate phosphoribosyltransferase-like protein